MKKLKYMITIVLILIIILIIFIIKRSNNNNFEIINEADVYAMDLKEIYKDDYFTYYVNCISLKDIYVVFPNRKITLKDALDQEIITPKEAINKYAFTMKERFKIETIKNEGLTSINLDDQKIFFHDLAFNYYKEGSIKPISLEEALINDFITIEVIIDSFENYLVDKTIVKEVNKDLGSIKYSNFEFSIIKCKDNSYHLGNYYLYANDVCQLI